MTSRIDVSFIIPHKGREALLNATVASIAKQDYDLTRVEVIIVSQNEIPFDHSAYTTLLPNIHVLTCSETLNISMLRNRGVEDAVGQHLAFLDADIALATNWLSSMLSLLKSSQERLLVSAVQTCEQAAPPLEIIRTSLSNAVIDASVRFLPGRNLFLHRDTFAAVKGFPEHLTTCEDYYFTDKVHALGELFYTAQSSYVHLGEDKHYDEMFKKEIWRGQSNLASLRGRNIPIEEYPSFLVPIWLFGWFIIGLVALASGAWLVSATAIAAVVLPILIYTQRLNRLCAGKVHYANVLKFYLVYFPARIIGTLGGLVKPIKA